MKQKLKKLKLILTTTLAGILLFACQVDKELTNDSLYQENGKIMHKTFEDLIQETQFKTAFEKINVPVKGSFMPKGNNTSRTVMESQYGFTIEDSPANVVVAEGITSYTFLIKRENTPNNVFENLIINLEPNKEPIAYLHKFTSSVSNSNEPIKIENFTGQKDLTKIEYNINQSSNKIQATEGCRIVREWFCGGPGNHTRDVEECGGHYIVSVKCTNGSSNQGNTTGETTTTGNTSGTSSNGGAETPTVVTAPVGPKPRTEILDQSKDPCETLKNTLDPTKANFKPAIVTLQGTLNQIGENGTTFGKNSAGNYLTPQSLPTTATNQISFSAVNNIYCIAHTHPADCYPMYSTPDVLSLLQLAQNTLSSNIPEISLMLVVKDDAGVNQVYAITIGNLDVFTVAMTNLLDTVPDNGLNCTPLQKAIYLDNFLGEKYNTDSNFERAFLKNFAGFGISLSKADSNLTKWNTLKINPLDLSINSNPCN